MEIDDFSAPEERQAISILNGIIALSAEITIHSKQFDAQDGDSNKKFAMANAMLALLDRLANLEFLERMHIEGGIGERCAAIIKQGLDEADKCLSYSAIKLVLRRAETVRARASAIISGEEQCSLGLSRHLTGMIDSVEMVVRALGSSASSPEVDLGVIDEARRAVTELALIEQRTLALPEYS